jgi:hypothetical protein
VVPIGVIQSCVISTDCLRHPYHRLANHIKLIAADPVPAGCDSIIARATCSWNYTRGNISRRHNKRVLSFSRTAFASHSCHAPVRRRMADFIPGFCVVTTPPFCSVSVWEFITTAPHGACHKTWTTSIVLISTWGSKFWRLEVNWNELPTAGLVKKSSVPLCKKVLTYFILFM